MKAVAKENRPNGSKWLQNLPVGQSGWSLVRNARKCFQNFPFGVSGLGPERDQTGTKTDCLVHLSGIGSEIIPKMIPKLIIWSIWAPLEPKWSKNTPTGHLEHLRGLGTEMLQNDT